MFGKWDTNVSVGTMPQKVATACAKLNEMVGAQYTPIAYLGSQQANGVNHAVLAEQTIVTGKDTKNIVLAIFNEKPEGVSLVNIERVIEGGGELGGVSIGVKTEIPEDAQAAFDTVLGGLLGASVKPFLLLATQVTKGTDYIFAATISQVVAEPKTSQKAAIVTVNALENKASFVELLLSKHNTESLGYAFNWLK